MTTRVNPAPLPQTTATLYQLADGSFSDDPTSGGAPTVVPVTDLLCVDDLDGTGAETTSDLQVLAQDVYHLLEEILASNLDDPTRGLGLPGLLNGTSLQLSVAAHQVDAQLRKDDRIDSSKTILVTNPDGSFDIKIGIVVDGALLPLAYQYSKKGGLVIAPGLTQGAAGGGGG
jgi:hypothetical protein